MIHRRIEEGGACVRQAGGTAAPAESQGKSVPGRGGSLRKGPGVGSSFACGRKRAPPPRHTVGAWVTVFPLSLPTVRLGPDGHLRLHALRADLTEGLPAGSRLRQALLRLSPQAPGSWDLTRQLQRQLRLGGPAAPALSLRLPRRGGPSPEARRAAQPRLELRWRPPAARGRRGAHAHARDECPLGEGRCCRLLSLRASIEDLGWADWVVAPRELDVRMCVGACPGRFRSASRHAEAQARLHGLKPAAAPAPCCVPAGYAPVVLLHRAADGRVALTPFDDLVAAGCHCQ